VKVWVWGSAY